MVVGVGEAETEGCRKAKQLLTYAYFGGSRDRYSVRRTGQDMNWDTDGDFSGRRDSSS